VSSSDRDSSESLLTSHYSLVLTSDSDSTSSTSTSTCSDALTVTDSLCQFDFQSLVMNDSLREGVSS
jgi:hypothetical protein